MTMPTLNERKAALGAAITAVISARNACREYCGRHTLSVFDALEAALTREYGDVQNAIADKMHRFDDVPILQATVAAGERAMRIAVAKPTALFEEPWISETMRDALERKLGATKDEPLRSMEAFPVLVVGRAGRAFAEIPNN